MAVAGEIRFPPPHEHSPHEPHVLRIQPSTGRLSLRLGDLWEYRELLYFLTWRDIKVRYKQTALGAAWAILQPFCMMVVFNLFFGRLAKMSTDGLPGPLFYYAGLVPWTFFATGVAQAANSLVGSSNMLKKIYFPRLTLPIATILSGLVDFVLAFLVLIGMMVYYTFSLGIAPTANVLWLPLFLLLAVITALGVGLWLAALNVEFRDVRYVVPFLLQFWMVASPVAYSSRILHEPWQRTLYGLNPMVSVLEGFRWALLGTQTSPGPMVGASALVAIGLLVSGLIYFRRMERTFADVV